MQDTSTDYEELAGSIQAGYFIKQGIANYNEDLFYMITTDRAELEAILKERQQEAD